MPRSNACVALLMLVVAAMPRAVRGEEEPAATAPVGRIATGGAMTPVNQLITPVGRQVELPGLRPQVLALTADGRWLVTSGKTHEVVVIDAETGGIIARVRPPADDAVPPSGDDDSDRNLQPDPQAIQSYTGLVFSPDGGRLFMSNVHGSVKVFTVAADGIKPSHSIQLPVAGAPERAREIPSGIALSEDGCTIYVCGNLSNRLLAIDVDSGAMRRAYDVGVAPYDVVLVGGQAFVSNWGGRRPAAGDLTGPAGKGTRVRVDPVRHTASEGSVSVVDLAAGSVREVLVGLHASALAVSPDHRHVVCANSAGDTLSILDAARGEVVDTVWTKRTPAELFGAMPNALAFSPDGTRLYVCNAAQNAVAVMAWDPDDRGGTRLLGLIPVGWHPGAVVVDAARGRLAVANIKGLPAKPKPRNGTEGFNSHHYHGSITLLPIPEADDLPPLSERVARNLRAGAIRDALLPPRHDQPPRPIPERIGEPSPIEHVVYVIKENRTYDQVLGDLPQGNGRPDLCIFGAAITPNQHALAREFVLLDNAFCCGILSADGHNWSTSAVATDYLERSFAGFPRSYPDGMEDADADAIAWSPAGFLWDNAVRHGKRVRNYGEFMMPRVRWRDPRRVGRPDFAACLAAWRAGPEGGDVVFASEPAIESLRPFSPTGCVGWDMSVPDQVRADFVIRELAEYERQGRYPNLVIICLPQDHTSGTDPRCPTPAACMADNDLAFGRIVEALSKSRFWPKMAIFAIEDDPQDGWDHVSGYRTTVYLAGPYVKRGAVIGTRFNTTSILRTIGQILGLPPLNQFDASATPMADCFTDVADLTPFVARPATVPFDRMNPDPQAIHDPLLRANAMASMSMNFREVDKAPEAVLNRVLWHAIKGSASAYPTWATGSVDDDDEHRAASSVSPCPVN